MILEKKIPHLAPAADKPKHHTIIKAAEFATAGKHWQQTSRSDNTHVFVLIPFITAKDYHQTLSRFLGGSGVFLQLFLQSDNLVDQTVCSIQLILCCSHVTKATIYENVKCNPFYHINVMYFKVKLDVQRGKKRLVWIVKSRHYIPEWSQNECTFAVG